MLIVALWIVAKWIVGVLIVGGLTVGAWLAIYGERLARGLEREAEAGLCLLMRRRHAPLCERTQSVALQNAIETDKLDRNGNLKVCLARARPGVIIYTI